MPIRSGTSGLTTSTSISMVPAPRVGIRIDSNPSDLCVPSPNLNDDRDGRRFHLRPVVLQ